MMTIIGDSRCGRPGSELFIVYTDERDTLQPGFPDLKNRAFVVKVNRLLRF